MLIQEEQHWLDATLQDVFGYHALQISPMPLDALRANRMSSRSRLVWPDAAGRVTEAPELLAGAGQDIAQQGSAPSALVAPVHELPFLTESLDLLVLPHTLEVAEDPHHLLREAQRVLIPEGKLVITGFNPWGLWVIRKSCRSVNGFPPAGHHWISLLRVKDWLKLLNFDLGAGGASAFGAYVPPFDSERWLTRLQWMNPAGRRWWPMAGGVYFLMAVKRVHHMKLVGPAWKKRDAMAGQKAAPVSALSGSRKEQT